MVNKTEYIKREKTSVLRSERVKPFDSVKFLKKAKDLREAVKKEEERYGPLRDTQAVF